MTFLILARLLVDYFWGVKALSVLHSSTAGFMLIRRLKRGLVGGAIVSDLFLIIFSVLALLNFLMFPFGNLVDLIKLLSIPLFYFLGRFSFLDVINYKLLGCISFLSIFLLLLMSITGFGYIYWGNYLTFTGGYFFKTDLALSVLILFSFALAFFLPKNYFISITLVILTGWLVWISNARISLLALFLSITVLFYYRYRGKGFFSLLIYSFLGGVFIFAIAYISQQSGDGKYLGFDWFDFWGEKNLQGRNWIWLAIIQYYNEYDFVNKMIGGGLSADVFATDKYSMAFGLENSRAHNAFLYLLVCLGFLGLFSFFIVLISWCFQVIKSLKNWDQPVVIVSYILLATFFVFSLTTETVIRAQIMVPLSFFMGRLVLFNLGVGKL